MCEDRGELQPGQNEVIYLFLCVEPRSLNTTQSRERTEAYDNKVERCRGAGHPIAL